MTEPDAQPVRRKATLSREEEADRALRSTEIRPAWAWALTLGLLLPILVAPVLQACVERRRDPTQTPTALRLGPLLPAAQDVTAARTPADVVELMARAPFIRDYETALEDTSVVTEWVLPPMQAALVRVGAGNEKAYCGAPSWLHYRPDVDYVTGPGFLEPTQLTARAREAAVYPDPVPAVVDFDHRLAARGIRLVVMPVPPKAVVHPETLAAGVPPGSGPPQNPSFAAFVRDLRRQGVAVADPTTALVNAARSTGRPQFLRADTHWTPEAMEAAAGVVAEAVLGTVALPAARQTLYAEQPQTVANIGDIALMLRLPPTQRLYPPQQVAVNVVTVPDGRPWRARPDADVLLLGDSYANIYSQPALGWGQGAGLAEHLSLALQRPVDRITRNDGGSHATREQLVRDMMRGRDRLAGKRVVIWEFAMRNLAEGDWKLLDQPSAGLASRGGNTP